MKFLCVPCDEPMKIHQAQGPDRGSMAIVYRCGTCGHDIAMLTNSMETQMVRSLGVTIGGRSEPEEPMDMLRSSLAAARSDVATEKRTSSSKCPFTGVVEEAYSQKPSEPVWTAEARDRIGRVPDFVRPMVKKGVEEYARSRGYAEISPAVMDEVKGRVGA